MRLIVLLAFLSATQVTGQITMSPVGLPKGVSVKVIERRLPHPQISNLKVDNPTVLVKIEKGGFKMVRIGLYTSLPNTLYVRSTGPCQINNNVLPIYGDRGSISVVAHHVGECLITFTAKGVVLAKVKIHTIRERNFRQQATISYTDSNSSRFLFNDKNDKLSFSSGGVSLRYGIRGTTAKGVGWSTGLRYSNRESFFTDTNILTVDFSVQW